MKLGVYNAILHDRPLPEALKVIADLGLTGIEINSGGFLPPVHIPTFDDILVSDAARELHPQNLVFNTADILTLVERTGAENVGVELDASHLFWQQMDPVAVVRRLGRLIYQAAAKDVRVNPEHAQLYGVLDNRFRRLSPQEHRVNLGGDEWADEWPEEAAWDFVALGKGHDVAFWTEFLRALHEVDPDMLVNIEHEDTALGRIEGLQVAAAVLKEADARLTRDLAAAAPDLPATS